MIRACIFDLDGTLLNTLRSLANSFNRSLEALGYPSHPIDDYRYIIGDGLRAAVVRCLPKEATEEEITGFTDLQQADYLATWRDDVSVYDGIETTLTKLGDNGVRLAALSNKNHEFTVKCIEYFFPGCAFDAVIGYGPDTPHKPDPAGALEIARRLNFPPAEIALVGDTRTDMQTAHHAGMLGIGALWGFRDAGELKKAGAKHIIEHPSEILAAIEGDHS